MSAMDDAGKGGMSGEPWPRFHAMDSLRGFAMLLGVFLHAALAYMQLEIPWPGRDEHPRMIFDVFVGAVHGFRMQLFFFIAGFFAHLLYHRIGEAEFVRHRWKRIGVPFLVGMVVLMPVVQTFWGFQMAFHAPGHLWFLEYLLIFYAAGVIGCRNSGRLLSSARWEGLDRAFARLMRSFWKPFLLVIPTAAILSFSPYWAGVEKSGASLVPTLPGLFYYGLFYVAGWWVHRQPEMMRGWTRHMGSYFGLAVVAFLLAGALMLVQAVPGADPPALVKLAGDSASALYTWLMLFALIGLFMRFVDISHPSIRYVADASYWIYLIHLPVVMYLQVLLQPYAWDALLKFAVVNGVALLGLFASYHWFVRHTFIGAVLNGERQRRRVEAPVPVVKAQ
jgi:peptidoglycan/LPS O-acetylase OafA/YrhL